MKKILDQYPQDIIDAFNALDLKPTDDLFVLKEQWKNRLKSYHPDKNKNHGAEDITKKIIPAFDKIRIFFEEYEVICPASPEDLLSELPESITEEVRTFWANSNYNRTGKLDYQCAVIGYNAWEHAYYLLIRGHPVGALEAMISSIQQYSSIRNKNAYPSSMTKIRGLVAEINKLYPLVQCIKNAGRHQYEGVNHTNAKRWKEANACYQTAIDGILAAPSSIINSTAVQLKLGILYYYLGINYEQVQKADPKSIQAYQSAVSCYENANGRSFQGYTDSLEALFVACHTAGEWLLVISTGSKLLDYYKTRKPSLFPVTIDILIKAHVQLEQREEVLSAYQKLLDFFRQPHNDFQTHRSWDMEDSSEESYRVPYQTCIKGQILALAEMATIYTKQQQWSLACDHYQQSFELADKNFLKHIWKHARLMQLYNGWLKAALMQHDVTQSRSIIRQIKVDEFDKLKRKADKLNSSLSRIKSDASLNVITNQQPVKQHLVDDSFTYLEHCMLLGMVYTQQYQLTSAYFYYQQADLCYLTLVEARGLLPDLNHDPSLHDKAVTLAEALSQIKHQQLVTKVHCQLVLLGLQYGITSDERWREAFLCSFALATAHQHQAHFEQALDCYQLATHCFENIVQKKIEDYQSQIELYQAMGIMYLFQEKKDAADQTYEAASRLYEQYIPLDTMKNPFDVLEDLKMLLLSRPDLKENVIVACDSSNAYEQVTKKFKSYALAHKGVRFFPSVQTDDSVEANHQMSKGVEPGVSA